MICIKTCGSWKRERKKTVRSVRLHGRGSGKSLPRIFIWKNFHTSIHTLDYNGTKDQWITKSKFVMYNISSYNIISLLVWLGLAWQRGVSVWDSNGESDGQHSVGRLTNLVKSSKSRWQAMLIQYSLPS